MGRSVCFVPGCKTGYNTYRKSCKMEGRKCGSLFLAPRDEQLFKKWKQLIPRADRELTRNDAVCELHFSEDDVERNFIAKFPDGTIQKLPREKPLLKERAIPIKFPNLPAYFTKTAVKHKEPAIHTLVSKPVKAKKSRNENMTAPDANLEACRVDDHSLASNECFSFNDLLKVINLIKVPSEWWSVTHIKDFIVCQKWNNLYTEESKVIVKNDLNLMAFIKDRQINLSNVGKVSDVEDITAVLHRIEELVECAGADNCNFL